MMSHKWPSHIPDCPDWDVLEENKTCYLLELQIGLTFQVLAGMVMI